MYVSVVFVGRSRRPSLLMFVGRSGRPSLLKADWLKNNLSIGGPGGNVTSCSCCHMFTNLFLCASSSHWLELLKVVIPPSQRKLRLTVKLCAIVKTEV